MRSGDRPGLQKRPYFWAASRTNGLGGPGRERFGRSWPDLPTIEHAIVHGLAWKMGSRVCAGEERSWAHAGPGGSRNGHAIGHGKIRERESLIGGFSAVRCQHCRPPMKRESQL